jgi:protein CWC15
MTTAHRPTWYPATGGRDQGGNRVLVQTRQYSSKDLPGHTAVKYRKTGQGTAEEVKSIDLKKELIDKEKLAKDGQLGTKDYEENDEYEEDEDEDENSEESLPRKKAHKSDEENDSDDDENDSRNDDESDFSEEELRKEIEKIKAERAEKDKVAREQEEEENRQKIKEQMLKGNPLLDVAPGFALKKKWTEETVFRNQCRDEPKEKPRFVNDTVRSDFHRKTLRKFIL